MYTLQGKWSKGQTEIHGLFLKFVASPKDEKLGYYFQLRTCLGVLETHVLLRFQWSIFCKWPVINVTLLTLKKVVHKYKAKRIFYKSINEII